MLQHVLLSLFCIYLYIRLFQKWNDFCSRTKSALFLTLNQQRLYASHLCLACVSIFIARPSLRKSKVVVSKGFKHTTRLLQAPRVRVHRSARERICRESISVFTVKIFCILMSDTRAFYVCNRKVFVGLSPLCISNLHCYQFYFAVCFHVPKSIKGYTRHSLIMIRSIAIVLSLRWSN